MRYPIDPLYYAAIHRFGSSLITHVHFRACVVDGVFKTVAGEANATRQHHRVASFTRSMVHDFRYAGIGFTRQLSATVKIKRRLTALIRRNWAADDSALLTKLV